MIVSVSDDLQVIVQAGGRGSRLRHHTWNKPKCLVSIQGKPILFHLFDRIPNAKFIVIGDYAFEQLEIYLSINKPAPEVRLIRTSKKGTCAGIKDALGMVDSEKPLLLIWSDLILDELPIWPVEQSTVVYSTDAFTCRWSISESGHLIEVPSHEKGIPGIFYFPKSKMLAPPPEEGEFVKWYSSINPTFTTSSISSIRELGDFTSIELANDATGFSRFFNEVKVLEDTVSKRAIDEAYSSLIQREISWYKEASRLGFRRAPKVYSEKPFLMERIKGEHLYKINNLSLREQRSIFADYIDSLTSLHDKLSIESRSDEVLDVYQNKSIQRVLSVSAIIPGFERPNVTVNGLKCRNIFHEKYVGELESVIARLHPDRFHPIHGDPTFSNTIIDDSLRVWFIDPRGYFSKPGIMGDRWYDFAKLYYSAIGGYDAFNRRKFKLHIDADVIEVLIEEPIYANSSLSVFRHFFGDELTRIEILHGLIWLSLSGYVKDDVDSIIAAFYLGLYWFEVGASKA